MFTGRQQMYKRSIKEKDVLDEIADQLALHGITQKEGHKEALGFYLYDTGGAKFWMGVLADLNNRSVQDILIACIGRAYRFS